MYGVYDFFTILYLNYLNNLSYPNFENMFMNGNMFYLFSSIYFISVLSLTPLLVSKLISKTSVRAKCYRFYNNIHKLLLISLQFIFLYTMCNTSSIENIKICLIYLYLLENGNIIVILLYGKVITIKRLCYILSCTAMLIQCIFGFEYLPYLFFFVNYFCELIKNIISIFCSKKIYINKYIYGFIKPIWLMNIFVNFTNDFDNFNNFELIVPLIVLMLSFYDSYIRNQEE